jgi:hypothetical protein
MTPKCTNCGDELAPIEALYKGVYQTCQKPACIQARRDNNPIVPLKSNLYVNALDLPIWEVKPIMLQTLEDTIRGADMGESLFMVEDFLKKAFSEQADIVNCCFCMRDNGEKIEATWVCSTCGDGYCGDENCYMEGIATCSICNAPFCMDKAACGTSIHTDGESYCHKCLNSEAFKKAQLEKKLAHLTKLYNDEGDYREKHNWDFKGDQLWDMIEDLFSIVHELKGGL